MNEPLAVREAPASYVLDAQPVGRASARHVGLEPDLPAIPQGYKQTVVGVIPEDWELKQICDLNPFITSGSRGWAAFYSDRGAPFIRITNLSRGSIYLDLEDLRLVNLPQETSEGIRTQLQDHDVLISITADIGIIGYVSASVPKPAYINQHIALVRFDSSSTAPKFISYFLASEKPQKLFRALTDSGAKAGMSLQTVQKIHLALPPTKAEQEAIAEALSDADALIEALEQLIAKKRQLKQGAMQELLTGKKRLSGFSGEWEVKALGDLFNFSGGFSASRDQLSNDGHCYLHYGDIHKSSKTYIDVRAEYQDIPKLDMPLKRISSGSLLDDGDVVFVDASEDDEGTSKHVVVVNKDNTPYISGLHTIVAKSNADNMDHLYKRYCFQTTAIKRQFYFYAVGTKVSGISKTNIAKVMIPVPSLTEQTAIATILSDMDTETAALETRLAKTRALKQGMMHNLLTGKMRLGTRASSPHAAKMAALPDDN
jgi:type I restriction enzyme S subunit